MESNPRTSAISIHAHFLILAFALLSIVFQGHQFGLGNHTFYLTWIEKINDPSFLPRDWNLSTEIPHPNVMYPLAWLSRLILVHWAFLLFHLATRYLLCLGVYRFSYVLFRHEVSALLAIVLFILYPRISLGGHYAHAAHFEANFLGFSLAALFLSFLFERRYMVSGIILGLLLFFHFFLGAHLLAILLLCLLFDMRAGNFRLRTAAGALGISLLISAPAWIDYAITYFTAPRVLSGQDVVEILCFRHPHHHSPFSWQLDEVTLYLCYVGIGIALAIVLRRHRLMPLQALYAYVAAACLVHVVFVELVPVALVAFFQSFRLTVLLMLVTAVFLARFIVSYAPLYAVYCFWGTMLVVLFRFPHAFIIVFTLGFVFLPIFGCPRKKSIILLRPLLYAAFFVVFLWLTNLMNVPYHLHIGVAAAIAAVCMPVCLTRRRIVITPGTARLFAFMLLLFSMALFAVAGTGRLNPVFEALRRPNHFRTTLTSPDTQLQETLTWIRENTPENHLFLIPPATEEFRLLARRACVVDWRSMTFTNKDMAEWFARIADILQLGQGTPGSSAYARLALARLHAIRRANPDPFPLLLNAYASLTPSVIEDLRATYHFDAILTYSDVSLPYTILYENPSYKVYDLRQDGN